MGLTCLCDEHIEVQIVLVRSYTASPKPAILNCPVMAIHPNNDVISRDKHLLVGWGDCTNTLFDLNTVDGTHFYFANLPRTFVNILAQPQARGEWMGDGAFELVSFQAGTPDANTLPFGRHPKGIIIYKSGQMIAHLWDSSIVPHNASIIYAQEFYNGSF